MSWVEPLYIKVMAVPTFVHGSETQVMRKNYDNTHSKGEISSSSSQIYRSTQYRHQEEKHFQSKFKHVKLYK
jgi:hypothetical protein